MHTFLLQTASSVALLVWGAYMVKTGILRTFGESLRLWLSTRLTNRCAGFGAGMGLAMLLQSSTASALLVAGLQAGGLVTTAIALSAVLGADLGSALVARILTLNISGLIPVLLIIGTFLFLKRMEKRAGQFGRLLLGFAFVLLALQNIMASTEPMRASPLVVEALAKLPEYPLLAAGAGIVCALLFFSSLAVVAVTASAVANGMLPAESALWVVLGANLGSALLAALTTAGASTVARKAPIGNFFFRVCGFIAGAGLLWLLPQVGGLFVELGSIGAAEAAEAAASGSADGVILFHVAYNTLVGTVGLFFIEPVARCIDRLFPAAAKTDDFEVRLLSKENLVSSSTALAMVRRENAVTAELFKKHWDALRPLIKENPPLGELIAFKERRKLLDRRCRAVSKALTIVVREDLSDDMVAEWQGLAAANDAFRFAVETMGRIVDLLRKKKIRRELFFSPQGAEELDEEHQVVSAHIQLLAELLTSTQAEEIARLRRELLLGESAAAADTPELVSRHMARVDQGSPLSMETNALHVDLLLLFHRVDGILANGVRGR